MAKPINQALLAEILHHMMDKRPLQHRLVSATTPRGKRVGGWLLAFDGETAVIRRNDGGRDFRAALNDVGLR